MTLVILVLKSVERVEIWLRRYSDLAASFWETCDCRKQRLLEPAYAHGPQTYYATTLVFSDLILPVSSDCRTTAESLPGRVESCVHALREEVWRRKEEGGKKKKYSACPRADRISLIVIVISWRGVVFGAFLTTGVLPTDGCLFECHRGLLYASLLVLRRLIWPFLFYFAPFFSLFATIPPLLSLSLSLRVSHVLLFLLVNLFIFFLKPVWNTQREMQR